MKKILLPLLLLLFSATTNARPPKQIFHYYEGQTYYPVSYNQPALQINAVPSLSIDDVTMDEGNSGSTIFSFTISLSQPAPLGGVTFNITTLDNTATIENNDYLAKSLSSQLIPQGGTSYSFDVTVSGDNSVEFDEIFLVSIFGVQGATISDGQGTGTVLNDDGDCYPGTYYADADGDGYQDESSAATYTHCNAPAGYALQNESPFDCNDNNANIYPGAAEITGNGIDENCNGNDDDDGCVTGTYYADADDDGYQDESSAATYTNCDAPTGYSLQNENAFDCNDNDASVSVPVTYYLDNDGDGFGDASNSTQVCQSTPPDGYVADGTDCNDDDISIYPHTYYLDADGDGFGDAGNSTQNCVQPGGYIIDGTDCDDTDPAIHPGATEIANDKDDNCDGNIDEGFCTPPVITGVTNITSSMATVHWNSVATADHYTIRKYPTGTTNYSYGGYTTATTDTLKKLRNMLPNTPYSVQVKSICFGGTDSSEWSAPFDFVTEGDCNPPSGLNVTNITATRATLNWSLPLSTAVNFQIRYRRVGGSWKVIKVAPSAVNAVLKNLVPNTEYEWKIRTLCTDDSSKNVTGPNFTTAAAFVSAGTTTVSDAKINYGVSAAVMPNPNTGNFTIHMQLPKEKAVTTLELFNSLGVKIWQEDLGTVSGAVSKHVYLENKLAGGVYMLTVQRSDGHYSTKIVVSK
jgi:hypothetical protein